MKQFRNEEDVGQVIIIYLFIVIVNERLLFIRLLSFWLAEGTEGKDCLIGYDQLP